MELLIPLGFFAMIAAIVLGPRYFRNKERQDMQQTVRQAIDKGQPLPPEVIEAITRDTAAATPARRARDDLRSGVVWLAIGLGIAAFGYAVGWEEREAVAPMLGAACIPGFIGLALIALGLIDRRDRVAGPAI